MIDLQKFCSTDELQESLTRPFSQGDFTYSANGHYLIRVPRIHDIPEQIRPDISKLEWPAAADCEWFAPPSDLDVPPSVKCDNCDGTGRVAYECEHCGGSRICTCECGDEHDCAQCGGRKESSDETTDCENCYGTGKKKNKTTCEFHDAIFTAAYICLLRDNLPNLQIGIVPQSDVKVPARLRFDGGDGMLMRCTR